MLKHVAALIVFVFIQGSFAHKHHIVTCINDFDRIITCEFKPDHHKPTNCSEYSVKVEYYPNDTQLQRSYDCSDPTFVDGHCFCTTDVELHGFLYGEDPFITLRRNGMTKDTFMMITEKTIKPKTPTIVSVNQTSKGEPNVTWLTHYLRTNPLSNILKTELKYRPKQSKNASWVHLEEIAMHKTHYVFKNLKLNTDYIVKARVYITFNEVHNFSDWSEEFTFFSGDESVTKKVVPVICLILILIVCTLTCCYVKIKKNWIKNEDSFHPKINMFDNIEKPVMLCPEETRPCIIDVLPPKEHIRDEEKGMSTSSVSGHSGNSMQTESSHSTSTSVDYGLTCHMDQNPVQSQVLERVRLATQQDFERLRQIQSAPNTNPLALTDFSNYKIVDMQEPKNVCGSNSAPLSSTGCSSALSFDNRCYSAPCYQSCKDFDQPMSTETDTQLIQTVLDYQSFDGSQNSEAGSPAQSETVERNRTFVSQPEEQKVSINMFKPCPLLLEQEDEYRSFQSCLISS